MTRDQILNSSEAATDLIRDHVCAALDFLNRDSSSNGYGILMYPESYGRSLGAAIDELTRALVLLRATHFPTDAEYGSEEERTA